MLETVPVELRARILGKTIKHDKRYTAAGQLRPGYSAEQDLHNSLEPCHPIIRKHPEIGHDARYFERRPNAYISGLFLEESAALLAALCVHATQPEFTWHQQWWVGEILMWDNPCVMHGRDAIDPNTRTIMHRTQGKGTPVLEA